MQNLIQGTISSSDLNDVVNAIKTIESKLPFLIGLTIEQRKSLLKLGDKSIPFVEKVLQYAESNPDLVPPYTDLQELQRDIELTKKLNVILRPLSKITEKVDDSIMAAGSDAFQAALTFYNSARGAADAGVKGSKNIYEDLKERYKTVRGQKEVESTSQSELN